MRKNPVVLIGALIAVLALVGLSAPTYAGAHGAMPAAQAGPGDPPGANDWTCKVSRKRSHAVILVHGTGGDRKNLLEGLSAAIKAQGFCVYSLDYGGRGLGDIVASAKQLKTFTNKVLKSSGAKKVKMVGHSQGGMMPRYYIKFLGGKKRVSDLVGISPSNHGTALTGSLGENALSDIIGVGCKACVQQGAGSSFLTKLNRGDETPGPTNYTVIATRYDEIVVPYTSGFLKRDKRTTNFLLQDLCPTAPEDHILIPTSKPVIAVAVKALVTNGPTPQNFRPAC